MPLHTDLLLTALVILGGLALIAASAFFAGCVAARHLAWWPLRRSAGENHIHCRYCYFGRAYPREESVRIDDDDLIEVTCFVCRSCSLPQWRVERSPVLKRAA